MTNPNADRHDDVRRFLQEMAEEMPPAVPVPSGLRHRVARRAARTVAAGTLALLVLVSSGVVGARALLQRGIEPAGDCRPAFEWTPIPQGVGADVELTGVTAVSSTDAWAVGQSYERVGTSEYVPRAVVLHWDGRAWTAVPTPVINRRLGWSTLFAVSGRAPDDVWAVGNYSPDGVIAGGGTSPKGGLHVLVEHWDGSRWSVVRVPEPPNAEKAEFMLNGVVAEDGGGVWIGGQGSYPNESGDRLLVERWNGTTWAVLTPPGAPLDTQGGRLAAIGPDDVWVVGSTSLQLGSRASLIAEHWDGAGWRGFGFPPVAAQVGLHGISGSGPADVWAVGLRYPQTGDRPVHAVLVHWDGQGWHDVALDPSVDDIGLFGVSATATGDAWAVGYSLRPLDPIVLHHAGSGGWDPVPVEAPRGVGRFTALTAVSTLSDGSFFAVGEAAEAAGGIGRQTRAIAGVGGCGR